MTAPAAAPAELEALLHREIPLAAALGVRVDRCDDDATILTAPFERNRNASGTAFGGSLAALAMLAGWLMCRRLAAAAAPGASVVIQRGTADFERPVTGALRARCEAPAATAVARFRETLARRGRARLALEVVVAESGGAGLRFRGEYVAAKAGQ